MHALNQGQAMLYITMVGLSWHNCSQHECCAKCSFDAVWVGPRLKPAAKQCVSIVWRLLHDERQSELLLRFGSSSWVGRFGIVLSLSRYRIVRTKPKDFGYKPKSYKVCTFLVSSSTFHTFNNYWNSFPSRKKWF